jgi:myosin heavy subunit
MNYSKRSKIFAGLVAGVVVFSVSSILGFFMLFLNREQLRQNLEKTKLEQERTVAEKLETDRDLHFLQKEFSRIDAANERLNTYLDRAELKIREKDLTIDNLARDNEELGKVKQELGGLKTNNKQLDEQVKSLTKSIDELIKRNQQVARFLEDLQAEQQQMRLEYDRLTIHKGVGRAFRVDAMRGDKITSLARRMRKMVVSFEPIDRNDYLKLKSETYYVVLSDEAGAVYNLLKNQKANVRLNGNTVELIPSFIVEPALNADKINRIALELDDLDLKGGVYTVEIYSNTAFVGSTQIRLN